jgi:hypothetical protein
MGKNVALEWICSRGDSRGEAPSFHRRRVRKLALSIVIITLQINLLTAVVIASFHFAIVITTSRVSSSLVPA